MAASHQHRFPTAQATGQMKTRTTACHHQKGTCKSHDLPIGQWWCFFSKPTWICDLKMLGGSKQYCWWFRNPANQLRLVVYPIIYIVLSPSQVVMAGFLPSTVLSQMVIWWWFIVVQKSGWVTPYPRRKVKQHILSVQNRQRGCPDVLDS